MRSLRDEVDAAELYDPSLHQFILTGKMHSARAGHVATLLPDGKVLVAGGFQLGTALASAEIYDPVSGTFSPTGSMVNPRAWYSATLLSNGKVLIAGGSNERGILPNAEVYDPATGKFLATGDMTIERMGHYAVALKNGSVLIVGGVRGGGPNFFFSGHNFLTSAELFDPGQGRFAPVSSGGRGITGGTNGSAVLLSNGEVLVAGGIDGDIIVDNARLYDPAQRGFLRTGSMNSVRAEYVATILSNGQVLVTGGVKTAHWPGPSVVATAEVYDPRLGLFSRLPDMTTPRAGHTATLLPDGEVLIAGGLRGSFLAVPSAELYRPASTADDRRPKTIKKEPQQSAGTAAQH
ncbi:MAG: Kelch repeat-containing protein [Candidatus Binataceae bacterium]